MRLRPYSRNIGLHIYSLAHPLPLFFSSVKIPVDFLHAGSSDDVVVDHQRSLSALDGATIGAHLRRLDGVHDPILRPLTQTRSSF